MLHVFGLQIIELIHILGLLIVQPAIEEIADSKRRYLWHFEGSKIRASITIPSGIPFILKHKLSSMSFDSLMYAFLFVPN